MIATLTPLGIPELDATLDTEYWVGASLDGVISSNTICAETKNPLTWRHYDGLDWVRWSTTPWRSRTGLNIRKFANSIVRHWVVSGVSQTDTLLPSAYAVTRIEISGDGSTYFIGDPTGWKVYDADSSGWIPVSTPSSSRLVPAFDGSAVCAISEDSSTVEYITAGQTPVLIPIEGTAVTYAGITDSVVIVARGSMVYAFANGVLNTSMIALSPVIGVYTDDESVWIATEANISYVSVDKGVTWLQLNTMRVVAPWLVLQNQQFFTVAFEPDPGQTGPSGPCTGPQCPTGPCSGPQCQTGPCSGPECQTGPSGPCSGPQCATGPTGPTGPKSNTLIYVALGMLGLFTAIAAIALIMNRSKQENKKTRK